MNSRSLSPISGLRAGSMYVSGVAIRNCPFSCSAAMYFALPNLRKYPLSRGPTVSQSSAACTACRYRGRVGLRNWILRSVDSSIIWATISCHTSGPATTSYLPLRSRVNALRATSARRFSMSSRVANSRYRFSRYCCLQFASGPFMIGSCRTVDRCPACSVSVRRT